MATTKKTGPIKKDEWLPIITSAVIGTLLVVISIFIWGLITGK
jgi:hypothetical protein